MIVMKFGGTSVGSADSIRRVIDIVAKNAGKRPLVVVSAVSGVTDLLIAAAGKAAHGEIDVEPVRKKHLEVMGGLGLHESLIEDDLFELRHVLQGVSFVRKVLPELYALVVGFGERMSSKIVAAAARGSGLNASAYNSYGLGLVTDSEYLEATILPGSYDLIASRLKSLRDGEVPIITGFIAKDSDGSVTTLGRGGSDYTASIFGIAASASEVQVWTDVSGILTADPKIVASAYTIREVSFTEAAELAYFGAKVLHPKTIYPAVQRNIPVKVLNTFAPEDPGTTIIRDVGNRDVITAIACKKNITTINIASPKMLFAYGFMERLFSIFAKHKVAVDNVSTSEVSVSVTVDSKFGIEALVKEIEEFAKVDVYRDKVSISVVGPGIKHTPGVAGLIFKTLGNARINTEMISMGASEINISFVVKSVDADNAVRLLHHAIFESGEKGILSEAVAASEAEKAGVVDKL